MHYFSWKIKRSGRSVLEFTCGSCCWIQLNHGCPFWNGLMCYDWAFTVHVTANPVGTPVGRPYFSAIVPILASLASILLTLNRLLK